MLEDSTFLIQDRRSELFRKIGLYIPDIKTGRTEDEGDTALQIFFLPCYAAFRPGNQLSSETTP
jgi:hypothetical protein